MCRIWGFRYRGTPAALTASACGSKAAPCGFSTPDQSIIRTADSSLLMALYGHAADGYKNGSLYTTVFYSSKDDVRQLQTTFDTIFHHVFAFLSSVTPPHPRNLRNPPPPPPLPPPGAMCLTWFVCWFVGCVVGLLRDCVHSADDVCLVPAI